MTGDAGVALLERAINYALGTVAAVTPESMTRPTPCGDWDLGMLLRHLNESLAALHEGIAAGRIALGPAADRGEVSDPAQAFRDLACRLLGAWAGTGSPDRAIAVADCPLTTNVVAGVGAIEIAVHGWDISRACGHRRPVPHALAADLLPICPLLVTDDARPTLFAAPVAVPRSAGPSDRLVSFLGRDPS
jgi:uncharacterized protein (TIGR03086 family)